MEESHIKSLREALNKVLKDLTPQEFMMYPKLLALAEVSDFLMEMK